jgi:NAD(P) transhydrogenase beta subunit
MSGHMNVLLAEAAVPYSQLYDMDAISPEFAKTDVALIVGVNGIVNAAARHDPASPIFRMPILDVDKARTVIVIKRSLESHPADRPGQPAEASCRAPHLRPSLPLSGHVGHGDSAPVQPHRGLQGRQ